MRLQKIGSKNTWNDSANVESWLSKSLQAMLPALLFHYTDHSYFRAVCQHIVTSKNKDTNKCKNIRMKSHMNVQKTQSRAEHVVSLLEHCSWLSTSHPIVQIHWLVNSVVFCYEYVCVCVCVCVKRGTVNSSNTRLMIYNQLVPRTIVVSICQYLTHDISMRWIRFSTAISPINIQVIFI